LRVRIAFGQLEAVGERLGCAVGIGVKRSHGVSSL
jgi:hypothetical protein